MSISSLEVGPARDLILHKTKFPELWNGKRERFADPDKTRISGALRCFCDFLEKSLPEGIVIEPMATDPITIFQKLWHEMQILCFSKQFCYIAEFFVRLDLFKMRLSQARNICFIVTIGAAQQLPVAFPYFFA